MEEDIRTVVFNWTGSVYHSGTHVLTSGFLGSFSCLTVCSVVWLYLYVYAVYLFGSFLYWNINWLLCCFSWYSTNVNSQTVMGDNSLYVQVNSNLLYIMQCKSLLLTERSCCNGITIIVINYHYKPHFNYNDNNYKRQINK